MKPREIKKHLTKLLDQAGIRFNGKNPCDVRILNAKSFNRALGRGAGGILEAYVKGWWDAERLDVLTEKALTHEVGLPSGDVLFQLWSLMRPRLADKAPEADFFESLLDRRLVYGSGYWKDAENLDQAQEAKFSLACRKLALKPGMRLLDVGCGWGSFARYAAEKTGVSVVGLDLSGEMLEIARQNCEGLPVEFLKCDCRDLEADDFDAAVSFGLLEYLEIGDYPGFLEVMRRCLKPQGLLLIHTSGKNRPHKGVPSWLEQEIEKPRDLAAAPHEMAKACQEHFVIEDWHNYGADFDRTLMAWAGNLERHWEGLKAKYGEQFCRYWKCYLLTSAGYYRTRQVQVWELVLSPSGVQGGYVSQR